MNTSFLTFGRANTFGRSLIQFLDTYTDCHPSAVRGPVPVPVFCVGYSVSDASAANKKTVCTGPDTVRFNGLRHIARIPVQIAADPFDDRVSCRDCQRYCASAHRCAAYIAAGLQSGSVSDAFAPR